MMKLAGGGVDIFYVDESMDRNVFAMSAVAIPFIRRVDDDWHFVWEDEFEKIRDWRKRASRTHEIPVKKELKGSKLASGRGRYRRGKHSIPRAKAARVYASLLGDLAFLPDLSIITVVGTRSSKLYGHSRLEASLYALLQRFRRACESADRNGLVFFDEGHGEYRKLYRKARVFLPTGSSKGGWSSGKASKNMPLDNFTKDANMKESHHSHFIQLADLISYAAQLKIRGEIGSLAPWQAKFSLNTLYDAIPTAVLNTYAQTSDPQGIVRL